MGYGSSVYNELSQHNRKIKIIESTTLKKEINEHNILSKNNLLKLDVQGSELDILKGLKEKINIFEAIILETMPAFKARVSFADVFTSAVSVVVNLPLIT